LDNANRYYQKRYCFTQVEAGEAVMYIYLSAIAFSLPLGLMVDKFGKRLYFFIGCLVVFLVAQIVYLSIPSCDLEIMDRKNLAYLGSVL
jgi:MFS family permease